MNRLKELRKAKNLSQNDVAKSIYTSQQNYSRYENEEIEPDYDTLKKLAEFFDVSIDYILCHEAKDLILISKDDFNTLKKASEIINKLDKAYNQENNSININGSVNNSFNNSFNNKK